MMSDVGENDQPENTPDNLPARPPAPQPPQESDWDPEKIRQFQEFLRFQQFQEFSRQQEQQQAQPTPPAGNRLLPAQQPSPGTGVEQQLAGMRRQLAEMSASQQRVEQVVNPPLWRKILRSNAVRWVAGLVVIAALAIWGVPALIDHYFGGNTSGGGGSLHPGTPAERHNYQQHPYDAVHGIYEAIAATNSNAAIGQCELFSDKAATEFASAAGITTPNQAGCVQAIAKLHQQVTDLDGSDTEYSSPTNPSFAQLSEPTDTTVPFTVSPCEYQVSGGPKLGPVTLTYVPSAGGWQITGYQPPSTCQSTAPSAPTTPSGF